MVKHMHYHINLSAKEIMVQKKGDDTMTCLVQKVLSSDMPVMLHM